MEDGTTPLFVSAQEGDASMVRFLLEELRENHLSTTTCLTHVFLKPAEQFGKVW